MFKRSFQLLTMACLVTGVLWAENDPFVGEWKLDASRSKLTDEMKVERVGDDKYAFDFGGGAETIATDGTDQPGSGGTTLSVSMQGPDSWKVVRKKEGHIVITATWNFPRTAVPSPMISQLSGPMVLAPTSTMCTSAAQERQASQELGKAPARR